MIGRCDMRKSGALVKVLIIIISAIILFFIVCIGVIINRANNTEVKMIGKNYVDFLFHPGKR
jgi:D-alanyl-lipoteichoic acid acyltransferase DltB (MBOAT superfamily)